MAQKTRNTTKTYFETGKIPSQEQYIDLMEPSEIIELLKKYGKQEKEIKGFQETRRLENQSQYRKKIILILEPLKV